MEKAVNPFRSQIWPKNRFVKMEKNHILMHNRVICIHYEKFRSLVSLERDAIMMGICISGDTLCEVECCHRSGWLFSAANCAVFST